MSCESEKRIALDRYARMLSAVAGHGSSVAYVGPDADGPWIAEGSDTGAIERALAEIGGCDPGEVPGRVALPENQTLLITAVPLADKCLGQLMLLVAGHASEERFAVLEAALDDAGNGASADYKLSVEADTLAEELSARYEELNLLYSMRGGVRAGEDGDLVAEALLQNLVTRLDVDLAAMVVADRALPIYASGTSKPLNDLDLVLTAMRGDLFRFTTMSKEPVVMNSAVDSRRQYLFANMPYRVMACPVLEEGTTPAMLVMLRVGGRPEFTNGDKNLGVVIANQTAVMMQNYAMLRSLADFGAQIAASLIEAIEAKDPYTRGHSERVQRGGIELGKAAELGATTVEDISWGALLHDVGKIGIPDSIICKAGSLSDDEYTMIKTHPERSYEIIRHIDQLRRPALDAARFHHERFDGQGYPSGLRGKQIPIEARVVSIADTYDALTSSRSYRSGRSHEEAMAVIRDVAGTQLDPDLVQVFDNIWRRDETPLAAIKEPPESGDA